MDYSLKFNLISYFPAVNLPTFTLKSGDFVSFEDMNNSVLGVFSYKLKKLGFP